MKYIIYVLLVLIFFFVICVVIIRNVFGDFFGVVCYEFIIFVVDGRIFFFNGVYCLFGVVVVDYMKLFILVFIRVIMIICCNRKFGRDGG